MQESSGDILKTFEDGFTEESEEQILTFVKIVSISIPIPVCSAWGILTETLLIALIVDSFYFHGYRYCKILQFSKKHQTKP